ncbi:MAG: hypothetical protein WB390_09160 [Pseudolabrys sp.]
MTGDPQSKAAALAAKIVAAADQQRARKMHFSIITRDHQPLPFPVHWKHKNSTGVTFAKTDTAAAEAWITTALLAGYGVCVHWGTRQGGGGVYSLADAEGAS